MLLSLDAIFKFLYPPNLEHSNANERLDMFALYGPVVNFHSVDKCLCTPCSRIAKEHLEGVKANKLALEKSKLGIELRQLPNSNKTMSKTTEEKIKLAPLRLLNEEEIIKVWD